LIAEYRAVMGPAAKERIRPHASKADITPAPGRRYGRLSFIPMYALKGNTRTEAIAVPAMPPKALKKTLPSVE
jgi:hypothetical protein